MLKFEDEGMSELKRSIVVIEIPFLKAIPYAEFNRLTWEESFERGLC
jgi:hypothetical protein